MLARLSAFVTWALVAATVVFWALRLLVQAMPAPSYVVAVGEATAARGDLTRLFGAPVTATTALAAAVPAEASSRFRLLGVMAPRAGAVADDGAHGVALMTVDGKLPKAFAVGSHVDADLVLQAVSLRTASIGPARGAPAFTLELARPTPAATGTLPVGGAFPNPAAGVPMTPTPYSAPPVGPAPAAPVPLPVPPASANAMVPPGSPLQINPAPGLQGNRGDGPSQQMP